MKLKLRYPFKIREIYVRWIGIAIVAFIVMGLEPDDHMKGSSVWEHYFVSWCFTALYWNGAYAVFMIFRKIFPEIKQTTLRVILTYLVLFIWMSIGGIPLKILFGFVEFQDAFQLEREYMLMNLVIALIVGTSYETVFFFEKWKDAIQQNELLKNQQIRTQFEVLQNQMSPHFLFNSLNTLTTLIPENQNVAMEFTQKLSDVYRYILQNRERELVSLQDELAFAEDFIFLLKMRYPDNLTCDFRVDPKYHNLHIAPLTIQMLLENAIKHNVVSKAHPLKVEVYVENGKSIVVKNNLQPKPVIEKSTKTGLGNIKKRYEYFGGQKIDIITTAKNFMVAIPLLEVTEDFPSVKTAI